ILLVTFAREQQVEGWTAFDAAINAGYTRIRPVLMTAAAMIVGMLPMAIGGPGEEQNAALARAVIGGLLFATPTTLLIVPYLFARLRSGNDGKTSHGVFKEEIICQSIRKIYPAKARRAFRRPRLTKRRLASDRGPITRILTHAGFIGWRWVRCSC